MKKQYNKTKNSNGIKKIAYTFVIADLFHYGILRLLEKASSQADRLICGVLTDEAVEKQKGHKPVSKFAERKRVVESIKYVDEVIPQHGDDPTENLKHLHEKYADMELIFVYGDNWKEIPGGEYLSSINASVVQQKFYDELSNSKIAYKTVRGILPDKGLLDTFTSQFVTDNVETFKRDRPPFVVTTKAQTLKILSPLLKKSFIEKMYIFTVRDWLGAKENILEHIQEKFCDSRVVIRSSSINEDSLSNSKAGYYHSELNINPGEKVVLVRAINNVIATYEDVSENNGFDQILVQKQTENIILSGVLLTHVLKSNAPYYIINYDEGENTSTVTSGQGCKSLKIFRGAKRDVLDSRFQKLLSAVDEIEEIIPDFPLDIEFAITQNKDIVIFQVRPLAANVGVDSCDIRLFEDKIRQVEAQYIRLSQEAGGLNGNPLVFSDMLFWNPAELIGHKPSNLAYSLFNKIIMERVWNDGLLALGYPNLFPNKLMERFLYKPYVNVNLSFQVLVPNTIPGVLHDKLQAYYLKKLKENPSLHDKAEFEIAFSCYDFNLESRLTELLRAGFSKEEVEVLREALISFTNKILNEYKDYYAQCQERVDELEGHNQVPLEQRKIILAQEKNIFIVKEMIDKCKDLGALPFTTVARLAFVAKALLLSLRSAGIINSDEYNIIMNSFSTVATDFALDANGVIDGRITADAFLGKYGHLRSGTYDLERERYDAFKKAPVPLKKSTLEQTVIPEAIKQKINSFFATTPLKINFDGLYDFASLFISARERFKFIYTRTLSDVLELIKEAGAIIGISAKDLSYLEVDEVFNIFNSKPEILREKIAAKKKEDDLYGKTLLPSLIFGSNDFWLIRDLQSRANFVSNKVIEGEIVVLDGNFDQETSIEGRIVFIENADPGFHWIFSRSIKGLVTKYGGAASHMAICCAEFDIPAAIGCGELYDGLIRNRTVRLDCAKGNVNSVGERV